MNKHVPLISSGTTGPLGVLHLPRFWLKVLLAAKGALADGYPDCGKGYDQMVVDGLGLDKDATLKFIRETLPTYPQFEAWVKKQSGVKLDAGSVGALNKAIAGYNHDDATRTSILGASGIPDEGKIKDAINLNNLDDWKELHVALTGKK